MIKKKKNPKKALGHDQITVRMLQELLRKKFVLLTYFFNVMLLLQFIPCQWKKAKIITLPKPGKPLDNAASY